ncbi:MAG: O-antigen ligase family protein [Spirochaetes bacterium]|nr:O-antigen ligase family protein [Spirochaetota bacterium]
MVLLEVLLFLTLLNPINGIYLVIAAFPLEFTETWFHYHVIKLYRIIIIFVFISWGLRKLLYRDGNFLKFFKNKVLLLLIGLIIWNMVTLSYSPLWKAGLGEIIRMIFYLLFLIVLLDSFPDRGRLKKLVYFILAYGLMIACIGLFEKISGRSIYYPRGYIRTAATFFDPNMFGRYLLILTLLSFSMILYFRTKIQIRILLIAGFVLLLADILFSSSRSALLAGIIGIIILLFFSSRWKLLLTIFFSVMVIGYLMLPLGYKKRIKSIFDLKVNHIRIDEYVTINASNRRRIALELGGLRMIRNHFLLGVGVGSFPYYFEDYNDIEGAPGDNARESHNFLMRTFAELGIIGFLLSLVILYLLLKKAYYIYKNSATDKWIALALLTILVGVVLQAILYSPFFYHFFTWVLIFLIIRTGETVKNKQI